VHDQSNRRSMRSSARRRPGTSSQWKAIAHWQRIDDHVSINAKTVRSSLARCSFFRKL